MLTRDAKEQYLFARLTFVQYSPTNMSSEALTSSTNELQGTTDWTISE